MPNPNRDKILETLTKHWELGKKIDKFCAKPGGTIARFARQQQIPERTVRTYHTFFVTYKSQAELEALKSLRRQGSGLPLTSAHVTYLLTVKSPVSRFGRTPEEARHKFAETAAAKNLTPSQLNAAIRQAYGRVSTNSGKPPDLSKPDVAMQIVVDDAIAWAKRCRATVEKLLTITKVADAKRNQMKALLTAFGEFCEAAKSVVKTKSNSASLESKLAALAKAQEKIASIHAK